MMSLRCALAAIVFGTSAPQAAPVIAFPGQWAPSPDTWKYPVWPGACRTMIDAAERLACDEFVLNDWPRLSRYAAANSELPQDVLARQGRVVFFGDSITDNWLRADEGGFFPGKPYVNRGIGGQTTAQMLLRFRADVIELAPVAVVILAGINDLGGNTGPTTPFAIEGNIASMAELALAHGIRPVLAGILPVSPRAAPHDKNAEAWAQRKNEAIASLNKWIQSYCRSGGLVFLDYGTALKNAQGFLTDEFTRDGLHPNAHGYARMAPLAEQAIQQAKEKHAHN